MTFVNTAGSAKYLTYARSDRVYSTFSFLVVAMIFLQKLGVNLDDKAFGLNLALLWLGLGFLLLGGHVRAPSARFILFLCLLVAMSISAIGQDSPAFSAAGILIAFYVLFTFQIGVTVDTASRCLLVFQKCMLIIAVIVIVQQIIQYTIGSAYWPNLDAILPKGILYPGFAYLRPYSWGSPYLEPNGVFFLEPSVLSYYIGIAIVIELVWFANAVRLAFYVTSMLACLAGTGPLMLILAAPFLAPKIDPRLRNALILFGAPLLLIAFATGWLDTVLVRSGELSNSNSSGYARIVVPLQTIAELIGDPRFWFSGNGAGSSLKMVDVVTWPFSKLLFEYGLATAVIFHLLLITSLFDAPLNKVLSLAMLLPFLFFGGGFVSPASVMPLLLFGSLLKVAPPQIPSRPGLPDR